MEEVDWSLMFLMIYNALRVYYVILAPNTRGYLFPNV